MKNKKDKQLARKAKRDADLARMREKYRKQKAKDEGETGGNTMKLQDGTNLCRILPRDGTPEFYLEVPIHFNVGPDGRYVRCIGRVDSEGRPVPGTKCPICKKFLQEKTRINTKYGRNSDDGKREYLRAKDAYHPKMRSYMNVLLTDNTVKVLTAGPQIMGELLEMYVGEDAATIGDFTDPQDGSWIKLKKKRTGKSPRDVEYSVRVGDQDAIEWSTVKDMRHDLDAEAGPLLEPDEITAIMVGEIAEDEDEDADTDAETDEDESEDEDDSQPACFGDPNTFDAKDRTCKTCAFFDECKRTPAVKRERKRLKMAS